MITKEKCLVELAKQGGMTLVEILVALAISGIVTAALYTAYRNHLHIFQAQKKVSAMQQNLRGAMYYLEREIRMAGLDPTGKAGADIITATNNIICFSEDISSNGIIELKEKITYTLKDINGDGIGDELKRNGWTVAENIKSLSFKYFDKNQNITTQLDKIRSIEVTLVATTKDNDRDRTLTSLILCRNLILKD